MKRIKVSDNFYLDEFINPVTYNKFGVKSQRYIRPELIKIAQMIRSYTGLSCEINNWATGGAYEESGLRDFTTSTGATYSAHKFGQEMESRKFVKSKGDTHDIYGKSLTSRNRILVLFKDGWEVNEYGNDDTFVGGDDNELDVKNC